MKKKFYFVIGAVGVIVALLAVLWVQSSGGSRTITIQIHGRKIIAETAVTPRQQYQGLSGRTALPMGRGMLFILDRPQQPAFVMREMKFPLDIIWLNGFEVVDISLDLQPEAVEPYTWHQPKQPVTAVLEVPAGTVSAYAVKVGDRMSWGD